MQVLSWTQVNRNKEDIRKHFRLKQFERSCADFVLVEAAFGHFYQWEQFHLSNKALEQIRSKKLVRLEFEEPNKFCLPDDTDAYDKQFDKIFTICPYTAAWLNKRQHTNKRIPIYYPVNADLVPENVTKRYDVIYTGTIVSSSLLSDLQTMSKYNYRFVSQRKHKLVTNFDVSYSEKLKLVAQSRVALVHNLLFPRPLHVFFIWRTKNWQDNKAFRLVPPLYRFWELFTKQETLIPQIKNRLFESALCRTLILCRKDPFNIIENFFEPNREFIYYDHGKLERTLDDILQHYKKYTPVIERAYKKVKENYTTKAFVKHYLSRLYR